MSTADQTRAAELHGTAPLLAQYPALEPLLNQLANLTGSRNDLRTQEAGVMAVPGSPRPVVASGMS